MGGTRPSFGLGPCLFKELVRVLGENASIVAHTLELLISLRQLLRGAMSLVNSWALHFFCFTNQSCELFMLRAEDQPRRLLVREAKFGVCPLMMV